MNPKMRKALNHFKKTDPILFSVAKKVDLEPIKPREVEDYFYALCYEIIGQQLAKKAAQTIFARFKKLFSQGKITPRKTLKISEQKMRNAGASWSKARFIRDLARKVADKRLDFKKIIYLEDAQVIEKLTEVKGIGPWTAQMFLIFTLGREDVFSHGDLGLRKAIIKIYSLREDASREKIVKITKKWSPYRTYACRILWKSLEL